MKLFETRITKSLKAMAMASVASAALTCGVAFADGEQTVSFSIETQDLGSALTEFGIQSRTEVLFDSSEVRGKMSNNVEGSLSTEEAIKILLGDTGVSYRRNTDGTLLVGGESATVSLQENMVTQPTSSVSASDNESTEQDPEQSANAEDLDAEARQDVVVVTGTNIRGVAPIGAPVLQLNREDIAKTGYTTVEELFESLTVNLDEISAAGGAGGSSRIASSNSQRASGISLRGLGPGGTLVLVNGKRRPGVVQGRVFDVSTIPLSIIERVEIVTGGRSSVYGSDAVAGVVNIVTKTELNGAETRVSYGGSDAGAERFRFNQTFGKTFNNSGFVIGYDYREDEPLDATEAGLKQVPSPAGRDPIPGLFYLRPPVEQHSALFAGHYNVNEAVELYADAHYSSLENTTLTGTGRSNNTTERVNGATTESDQYSIVAGVKFDLGNDWQIDASALHGETDTRRAIPATSTGPFGTITSFADLGPSVREVEDESSISSFAIVADGPIFDLGSGTVSGAFGLDVREETYNDSSRDVMSVFGEVYAPIFQRDGQKVELSLAGRYDDYSDFGSTFNPQVGLEWQPTDGLSLRGSYATAFRAPDLVTLDLPNQTLVFTVPDPMATVGTTAQLFTEFGGNPDLQPEEADTYTFGADFEPFDGLRLSLSYFNVEYTDRIEQPTPRLTDLADEGLFPGLIDRNPSEAQVAGILDRAADFGPLGFFNLTGIPFIPGVDDPFATFPNLVVFDNRRNNLGVDKLDGLDFQIASDVATENGDWSFELSGTYYLGFDRNITTTSPTISQYNQPGNIVDLRLRGRLGWELNGFDVNGFVNYVNDYEDTLASTPTSIDSWTTFDLSFGLDAGEFTDSDFLSGVRASLSISNLLDEEPPVFLSDLNGVGYDNANSNALGRYITVGLTKTW